jgi:hypothetical protein
MLDTEGLAEREFGKRTIVLRAELHVFSPASRWSNELPDVLAAPRLSRDSRKPALIRGSDLRAYLNTKAGPRAEAGEREETHRIRSARSLTVGACKLTY